MKDVLKKNSQKNKCLSAYKLFMFTSLATYLRKGKFTKSDHEPFLSKSASSHAHLHSGSNDENYLWFIYNSKTFLIKTILQSTLLWFE